MSDFDPLHDSHHREPPDRPPGNGPVPLWLAFLAAALGVWALGYLVSYNAGFRGDVYDEAWTPRAGEFTAAEAEGADPVVLGEKVYRENCAICHQNSGQGILGVYPPLAGSEVVLGQGGFGENHLARIVLGGLVDPVTVRGASYSGAMPPWRELLPDPQLAAVLTYVRQAWGNQAGPVAPAQIALLRAELGPRFQPWTVAELQKLPPAPLPEPLLKAAAPAALPSGTR